uniref:Deoxycytidylate deaminase n=1 Tax=Denticeps clupeoides TaxID=299321 RepID=A0AAY4AA86_9TELE
MDAEANGNVIRGNGTQGEGQTRKREDYLEWPEYFMAVAFLSAQRSKDPSSQVGACIVNLENKIVGIGYNGMPNGCSDDLLPWNRSAEDKLNTKYPYVCHAELNAIMNKNSADVKGCTMYVALFPCNECAKLIIQAGSSSLGETRLSLILIQLTTRERPTRQAECSHLERRRFDALFCCGTSSRGLLHSPPVHTRPHHVFI